MRTFLLALLVPCLLSAAEGRRPLRTQLRVAAAEQDPPLDSAAFKATLDGNPTKVLRVRGPKDDLILLIVLDLTGDLTLVDAARNALTERIAALPKNNWVAVLKSQDILQVIQDPSPDRDRVAVAIRDYAPTGKAGLLTTIESAASLGDGLLGRTNVRVAVLYVTDSNIYNYREDFTNPVINSSDSRDLSRRFPDQLIREKIQKLSDSLAASETPLFFVHLNYFSDPINEAYQRGLMQLVEESGGAGAFCRSRGEIPDAVEKIVAAAATHWSVAVELRSVKSRTATVDLSNGDRDVRARARFSLRK
ncbi:MAG: hypothetical protein HYX27_12920 [Acidobacteria bacterium]|nr:hypothetical protein [Acidobacteriota bacterium]